MSLNDKNKLNRLEELKSKLFSKNYHTRVEQRDGFSHTGKKEVVDSWNSPEKIEPDFENKFFMKTSMFKKLFIFSIVFFALTLLYAGYVFFAGSNTVSNDNIEISILGNNFTAGGETLDLIVGIINKNSSPLDLVDLVVEYPRGGASDSSTETERLRQSLGTIPAGAVRNENLKLVLFGEQGSIRPIKITLEYRVAGSNAIFIKEKLYNVNINSTPINLSIDAPSSISPNQTITLNIKTTLNASKPAEKMLVKLDYPVGFQFIKSAPAPSYSNNIWSLGDLAPGAEHSIAITGKMVDVFDGEEKTFNVSSGSQSASSKSIIGVVFNSLRHTVTVSKPFIEANLYVNGENAREYAVDAKTPLNIEVRYTNNLDTKVDDLKIRAKISGNAFNEKTVNVQRGYYDSSKDTITWDKTYNSRLREVNPGDSDSVSFSVSPLSLFSPEEGLLSSPAINIEVDIEGSQAIEGVDSKILESSSSAAVKIISDVGFSSKALYYSGPFTNSGPIPPKAETETTYTILWTLSNTSNSISDVEVNSTLPPWVTFEGSISPAAEDLSYNASTRSIQWKADRIPRGAGVTGTARSAAFKISLKPSGSDVGSTPTIINTAILTGHDDFANVDVRVVKGALNTRLESDPAFPKNGGNVVP
ncbi:hypothetical protein HYW73_00565 [Candidatus Nomurabacteria bacterium]|nr:hypothetical protein [Candidatus Nomurabacteria bacterium]